MLIQIYKDYYMLGKNIVLFLPVGYLYVSKMKDSKNTYGDTAFQIVYMMCINEN